MSFRDEVVLLQDLPPFAKLESAKLKLLAFASQLRHFVPGDVLIAQGEKADTLFVILEGKVEISLGSGEGSRVVRVLEPPAFVGEIAILHQSLATATVTATTALRVLMVSRDVLLSVIGDVPELGRGLARHMESAGYVFE
ncbi:MAG: cyclic nucleotide-binding domain-containing protein [Alphaproteobacteria bacterium]|jgi:CRP-like cAMP-binding protein|nr:cyclic nucleotide-binding domain-containing protein [Alphaproteobacteria bacterium]